MTLTQKLRSSPRCSDIREKIELLEALEAKALLRRRNRLASYNAYPKQREFHAAGAGARERLLMAANQVGKSYCGAAETAMHLTGRYPDWWEGKRFEAPIRAWAASVTSEVTRDTCQRLLVGDPADESKWGEGLIPHEALVRWSRATGVPNALNGLVVQHTSGGKSTLGFKSYDQGRKKFQGETLDLVWFDEEPPRDIYSEGITRTNTTGGIGFLTFTPLMGMSDVVASFLDDESAQENEGSHETRSA